MTALLHSDHRYLLVDLDNLEAYSIREDPRHPKASLFAYLGGVNELVDHVLSLLKRRET